MDDFLKKLKKLVRIVLYGPAISQSDCRRAGPYQLPSNKNWERQCANGELLEVQQRSVCHIKKHNVTEMTLCSYN